MRKQPFISILFSLFFHNTDSIYITILFHSPSCCFCLLSTYCTLMHHWMYCKERPPCQPTYIYTFYHSHQRSIASICSITSMTNDAPPVPAPAPPLGALMHSFALPAGSHALLSSLGGCDKGQKGWATRPCPWPPAPAAIARRSFEEEEGLEYRARERQG